MLMKSLYTKNCNVFSGEGLCLKSTYSRPTISHIYDFKYITVVMDVLDFLIIEISIKTPFPLSRCFCADLQERGSGRAVERHLPLPAAGAQPCHPVHDL